VNAPFSYASPTLSVEALKHSIAYKLMFTIGKDPVIANKHEWLNATLFAVRDRLVERWLRSNRAQLSQETRQVYYLSMEFLIGRTLSNALLSLGIYDDVKNALEEMGLELEELIDEENDPGLGNGGLGRLAACFLDSLATLALPGRGYGIRYDYGMFKQNIVDGRQKESPDYWLEYGNPWEFKRHNTRYKVRFGGRLEARVKPSPGAIDRTSTIDANPLQIKRARWRGSSYFVDPGSHISVEVSSKQCLPGFDCHENVGKGCPLFNNDGVTKESEQEKGIGI
jgi:starch phosphorylase